MGDGIRRDHPARDAAEHVNVGLARLAFQPCVAALRTNGHDRRPDDSAAIHTWPCRSPGRPAFAARRRATLFCRVRAGDDDPWRCRLAGVEGENEPLIYLFLVPRLCLGTRYPRGSASLKVR